MDLCLPARQPPILRSPDHFSVEVARAFEVVGQGAAVTGIADAEGAAFMMIGTGIGMIHEADHRRGIGVVNGMNATVETDTLGQKHACAILETTEMFEIVRPHALRWIASRTNHHQDRMFRLHLSRPPRLHSARSRAEAHRLRIFLLRWQSYRPQVHVPWQRSGQCRLATQQARRRQPVFPNRRQNPVHLFPLVLVHSNSGRPASNGSIRVLLQRSLPSRRKRIDPRASYLKLDQHRFAATPVSGRNGMT
jgi:hypothetical protein